MDDDYDYQYNESLSQHGAAGGSESAREVKRRAAPPPSLRTSQGERGERDFCTTVERGWVGMNGFPLSEEEENANLGEKASSSFTLRPIYR